MPLEAREKVAIFAAMTNIFALIAMREKLRTTENNSTTGMQMRKIDGPSDLLMVVGSNAKVTAKSLPNHYKINAKSMPKSLPKSLPYRNLTDRCCPSKRQRHLSLSAEFRPGVTG